MLHIQRNLDIHKNFKNKNINEINSYFNINNNEDQEKSINDTKQVISEAIKNCMQKYITI